MPQHRFIEIDGKRYLWRDILQLRREQQEAIARAEQPTLFELKNDRRPEADCTAAGRFREPSLFSGLRCSPSFLPPQSTGLSCRMMYTFGAHIPDTSGRFIGSLPSSFKSRMMAAL